MVKYLESEDFNSLIKDGVVLVDFYANWCGPCKMLAPVLDELANDRADFEIVKVDVDKHDALARSFGIMSIPTMLIFKDGILKKTMTGFMPKEKIVSEVSLID